MLGNKNSVSSKFQPILKSPQSYKMSFVIEISFFCVCVCGHWQMFSLRFDALGFRDMIFELRGLSGQLGWSEILVSGFMTFDQWTFSSLPSSSLFVPLYWLSDRVYDIKQHLFMKYYRFMTKI